MTQALAYDDKPNSPADVGFRPEHCLAGRLKSMRERQSDLPPAEADRYKLALRSCALNEHSMLANRIGDAEKQRFVDRFMRDDRLSGYPLRQDDQLDENEWPGEDESRHRRTMQATLASEIRRAFSRAGFSGADPVAVATDLLASEHGDDLREIISTPLPTVSVPLVLAHLETLGFGLPPQVAVSVARRAMMVLLNRHHFADAPDARG